MTARRCAASPASTWGGGDARATTSLHFRHLLEAHALTARILAEVNALLGERQLLLRAIIAAPSSTKSQQGARNPEMHQTKKGQQWYFEMKAHIGVEKRAEIIAAHSGVERRIAAKRGPFKALPASWVKDLTLGF